MVMRSNPQNAVSRLVMPEPFSVFAYAELDACPPWDFGHCFNSQCSVKFTPRRADQIYCCTACERASVNEQRRWGHKMALPLLIHRIGKYNNSDEAVMNRTKAARRYVTQCQSAWLGQRQEQKEQSNEQGPFAGC